MRKWIGVVVLGLCVAALMVSPVFSAQYDPMTAKVITLTGQVHITKASTATPFQAKVGDILAKGDAIETKADGKVEFKTENGNVITLGPKSQMTISELSLDKATGNYQTSMDSKFGNIMAKVEAKIKDHTTSKFEIKTPVAVCGARGTVFYVVIGEGGVTQVYVASGSVNLSDSTGENSFVVVENAAAAVAAAGGEVTELTGAEKDAIIAEYQATLDGGEGEGGGDGGIQPPSQGEDPQSLTEVTPPQNPENIVEEETETPSESSYEPEGDIAYQT